LGKEVEEERAGKKRKGGRVEEWKNGRVEGWKNGRMEEWKDGRMEGWKKRIEVDMHEAGPYGGIAPPPDRCPTGLGCGDTPLAALLSEGCMGTLLSPLCFRRSVPILSSASTAQIASTSPQLLGLSAPLRQHKPPEPPPSHSLRSVSAMKMQHPKL